MPAILAPIAAFLAMTISSMVGRVLFALGLGVVTYTSIQVGLDYIEAQIATYWSGVGADILAVGRMAGFGEFMSIIFSAWSAVIAIKVINGVLKKLTFVPSGD